MEAPAESFAAVPEVELPQVEMPPVDLPYEDGVPMESSWHRTEINLLIESLRYHWRGRQDFYAAGNMFIYFDLEQVSGRYFRGPDFFVVLGVDGSCSRKSWIVWAEGGRYPDVIVELLSPTTANRDRTEKKEVYEKIFRTPEYFCYDPDTRVLEGWRLRVQGYEAMEPNEGGWLWSNQLGLWLGLWEGRYLGEEGVWLRFYEKDGVLVPTFAEAEAERAEQERQRAEQERQRAEQLEAELARLRERLRERGIELQESQ